MRFELMERKCIFLVVTLFLVIVATPTLIGTVSSAPDYYHHKGGVPPGLLKAWAHSNMSVVAKAVTEAIFLSGYHGVALSKIAIEASSSNQIISKVAYNETVVHIQFDRDGDVNLIVNSSVRPNAVFGDDMPLAEASSTEGLTPESEAWFYDEQSQILTISADPTTITLFYMSVDTIIPEFPVASMIMFIAFFAVLLVSTRAFLDMFKLSG